MVSVRDTRLIDDVHHVGVQSLEVRLRPLPEFFEHRPQRLAARGEPVGVVACCCAGVGTLDDPDKGEEPESCREDVGRDVLGCLEKFGVVQTTVGVQVSNNEQGPLVTEDVEPGTYRAHRAPVEHLGVRAHFLPLL